MEEYDFAPQLQSIIDQYGVQTPESIPLYKSLLEDILFDHPKEMNLLIAGLGNGIPSLIIEKKRSLPRELMYDQLINQFSTNTGMDQHSAQLVIKKWVQAIGYANPSSFQELIVEKESQNIILQTLQGYEELKGTIPISGSLQQPDTCIISCITGSLDNQQNNYHSRQAHSKIEMRGRNIDFTFHGDPEHVGRYHGDLTLREK